MDLIQHDIKMTFWAFRFAAMLLFVSIAVPAIVLSMRHLRKSGGRISLKVMFVGVAGVAVYLAISVLLWHSLPDVD
jgi:NADH:ubiquinone oxidoreductase subunit K